MADDNLYNLNQSLSNFLVDKGWGRIISMLADRSAKLASNNGWTYKTYNYPNSIYILRYGSVYYAPFAPSVYLKTVDREEAQNIYEDFLLLEEEINEFRNELMIYFRQCRNIHDSVAIMPDCVEYNTSWYKPEECTLTYSVIEAHKNTPVMLEYVSNYVLNKVV